MSRSVSARSSLGLVLTFCYNLGLVLVSQRQCLGLVSVSKIFGKTQALMLLCELLYWLKSYKVVAHRETSSNETGANCFCFHLELKKFRLKPNKQQRSIKVGLYTLLIKGNSHRIYLH